MSLEKVLKYHREKYPKMQPCDAVKLVYQNELGGGHLIKDREGTLRRLIAELEATPTNPSLPLFDPIGNGLVRVNLARICDYKITPAELNEAFVLSAAEISGTVEGLVRKLSLLEKISLEEGFSFSHKELCDYIAQYKKAACPPISHSDVYRAEYAPAYRVVLEKYIKKFV